MAVRATGVVDIGFEGALIEVECHTSKGLPNIILVGLASKAVDEAKERIRSAFASLGLVLPRKRITINLAPADLPKNDSSFDFAIAIAVLAASHQLKDVPPITHAFIGELGLDGALKPVRGIIGKLLAGREKGITTFWVPQKNIKQAQLVPGVTIVPVIDLLEACNAINGTIPTMKVSAGANTFDSLFSAGIAKGQSDFKDIAGQQRAKRALEIAAAGNHNVFLTGPPGSGKSLLARALPSILTPLTMEEALEVSHLHSLGSLQFDEIICHRPFRSPHHTASDIAIIGGGQQPKPGEISLSHRGVLFMDEFPEFNRSAIEALRQPLEDRRITVSRAKGNVSYPANFMLIATSNPCPCGYYRSSQECRCTAAEIVRYEHKVSGPILDRIDIYVEVEAVNHKNLLSNIGQEEPSQAILSRVRKARSVQAERYSALSRTNGDLTNQDIKEHCQLSPAAKELFDKASDALRLSARAYMRTLKVARTIADLDKSPVIESPHVTEALCLSVRLPA
jgi:magnesium chelatase family protein